MSKPGFFILIVSAFVSACTEITVRPVDASMNIKYVCIQENPKVRVSDFLEVVRDGFDRHGIASEVFAGPKPDKCEYMLTYTAIRAWDFKPYMTHAELRIEKEGRQLAYAEFHLKGKGGFALTKFASTKEKMDPVMEELLKNVKQ